jgi:murein L,D-transpeptidase YafK
MKKEIVIGLIGIFLLAGCNQKIKPNPKDTENNSTNLGALINSDGVFNWKQNDEVIKEGVAAKMVVVKSKRVLVLFDAEGNVLSRHRISLGEHPVGTKLEQGDKKTPEGTYSIVDMRTDPKYYKEILISYPNAEDRKRSQALGLNPGGGITFHAQVPWNWDGKGDDYTLSHDWTIGCMALTNKGMDNVWNSVNKDTVVEIRP